MSIFGKFSGNFLSNLMTLKQVPSIKRCNKVLITEKIEKKKY